MGKRWRFHNHDPDRIATLESRAKVPPIVAQLLLARGVTDPNDVETFLSSKMTGLREPDLLPGLSEAADRIHAAIQAQRRIVIYGDYDADGMTATGLLYSCLRLLHADVGLLCTQPVRRRLRAERRGADSSWPSVARRWSSRSTVGSPVSARLGRRPSWAWS